MRQISSWCTNESKQDQQHFQVGSENEWMNALNLILQASLQMKPFPNSSL